MTVVSKNCYYSNIQSLYDFVSTLVDSDDLGDDDDDYNPGGYEAVYCIGKYS